MASPGWMYHPLQGKQLFPDLTPAFQRQLEAEGWRDSPEKVGGPQQADASPPPPPAPAKADIRNIGIPEFMGTAPSHPILASNEALARMARIIDRDGDRCDGDLSVEELTSVIDHMGAEELDAVCSHLGLDADITFAPHAATMARARLLNFLRPDAANTGLDAYVPYAPPSDGGQQPFDMTGAPGATAAPVQDNNAVTQRVVSGADGPALVGTVTLDAFIGTTEAERVRWLETDATKANIALLLDERQVAYKTREDKAALAEKLLASLTNEV